MSESVDAKIDPELQFPHASRLRQEASNPSQSPHPYYFQQQRPSNASDLNTTPHDADESPDYDDDDDKDQHSNDGQGDTQNAGGESALDANGNPKRSRACDNCRRDKQKCEPSDDPSDIVCKRCKRGNKNCVVTPSVKKRQKKENNAVSKLQEEVAALKAMIQGMHGSPPTAPSPSTFPPLPAYGRHMGGSLGVNTTSPYHTTSPGTDSTSHSQSKRSAGPSPGLWSAAESDTLTDHTDASSRKRQRIGSESDDRHAAFLPEGSSGHDRAHSSPARAPPFNRSPVYDHSDSLTKLDQLISPDISRQVYERYTKHIALRFPIVPVAAGITAEQMRATKPFLYLSIVACSSFTVPNHLVGSDDQVRLGKLFIDQCAQYVWRNAEKSFEIVQGLQLGILWYRPPSFEQHLFYSMTSTATAMALDLGSGKRASPMIMKMGLGPFRKRSPDADSIDGRRAFLVCYYMNVNTTMVLRRPLLLHWSKYMEDCVKYLETSPDALPTDPEICYHVKIAHVAEEIIKEFKLEEPTEVGSLTDPSVIRALREFRGRLEVLKNERPAGNQSVFILTEQIVNLYLHEIALHTPQNADDFRPPFGDDFSKSSAQISGNAHVDALTQCFVTCHGILDTFLGMPYEYRLVLPVIFSVRTIYGVVCLIKFWGAVTSPGNLSNLFRPEDLKVDYYLDRLMETFRSIVDRYPQAPHGKFYSVARSLKERFKVIKEGGSRAPDGSIQFPCPANSSSQEESRSPMPPPSHTVQNPQQTSLHLLSEVAIGNPAPHQQQMQAYQQPLQQPNQFIDPTFGVTDQTFGPNDYDFSLIDFNSLGMLNTDLSGLFTWDPVYSTGYIGEMGQAMGGM